MAPKPQFAPDEASWKNCWAALPSGLFIGLWLARLIVNGAFVIPVRKFDIFLILIVLFVRLLALVLGVATRFMSSATETAKNFNTAISSDS